MSSIILLKCIFIFSTNLTYISFLQGLDAINSAAHLRPLNSEITAPRIDSYRFSMANLEDSQDVDLDAILGELCALSTAYDREIGHARDSKNISGEFYRRFSHSEYLISRLRNAINVQRQIALEHKNCGKY